jgi:hypothetical protein
MLVIAEVVEEKDDVHVVRARPESLHAGIWVGIRGEEFDGRSSEVALFLWGEDAQAIRPCSDLWDDGVVVGVESWRERADALEVWESEEHLVWRNNPGCGIYTTGCPPYPATAD